jgi:hypothetical protein
MGHATPQFYGRVLQLVKFALHQSRQFIGLLDRLGTESAAIKSNATAVTVLNHIRRESEYFIGIAQALLYGRAG